MGLSSRAEIHAPSECRVIESGWFGEGAGVRDACEDRMVDRERGLRSECDDGGERGLGCEGGERGVGSASGAGGKGGEGGEAVSVGAAQCIVGLSVAA